MPQIKQQQINKGKLTMQALALSGALAAMATASAQTRTFISGTYTAQSLSSGNLIVYSGATILAINGAAVSTSGTIGTVSNSGTISSDSYAIANSGTINTLTNSGMISGNSYAIRNSGTISTLINTGTINGNYGIVNIGTLSTLINSGTISGNSYAIYTFRNIGTFINTGTIVGNIFNNSSTALTITGGSGTIYGTLTGDNGSIGSIGSAGGLSLTLSGNQLLNDNVNVSSGILTNTGTLQINNPLTITGNYVQDSGATLIIGVVSPTFNGDMTDSGYGRLYVTGNATLDNSTITVKSAGYALAQGQRYVVVSVGSNSTISTIGVTYTASGYTVTGTTQSDSNNASYTDLVLTLSSVSSDSSDSSGSSGSSGSSSSSPINRATSSNAVAALNGLFKYSGTDASLLSLYNPAAALDNAASANQAGAQLSPTALNSGALHAVETTTQAISNITTSHLDGLRLTQAGGSGIATGESTRDIALWGQAFGGRATQGLRDNVSGYHANYHGLLIGADGLVTDALRTGALISATRTTLASDGDNTGSSARINNYGATAYATYTGAPWYINLLASAARQQYSTVRSISYTGFSGIADGSFNGRQYSSAVQAGYPLNLERWLPCTTLTPTAGLSYSTLRQNGYIETGDNGAALKVNAASANSLKSELGTRLEQRIETSYGQLLPSIQLGWRHEYRAGRVQTGASFVADGTGSTAFVTQGASPIANVGMLNLGVTLLQGKHLSLSAQYTLESGDGYTAQTGSMLVRWQY